MAISKDYAKVRSFLINNLEVMLESVAARREHKKNDSEDIFSMLGTADLEKVNWKRVDKNLPNLQLLQIEKNSLGIYMSGNPLIDFNEILMTTREVTGMNDFLHIAIVEKVKKIFTKAGAMMFALQVTLIDRELEGVIYSKRAMEYSPILEENNMYWIAGRIDDKAAEQAKLKAEMIEDEELQNLDQNLDQGEDSSQISSVEAENTPSVLVEDKKTAEYVEKPKIVVNHICRFEEGLGKFLEGLENKPSNEYIAAIPTTDWQAIKLNPKQWSWDEEAIINLRENKFYKGYSRPQNYKKSFGGSSFNKSDYKPQSDFKPKKQYEPPVFKPVIFTPKPREADVKVATITFTKDLSPALIGEIKKNLQKKASPTNLPVIILIENRGELKRAKGEYWIDRSYLQSLPVKIVT